MTETIGDFVRFVALSEPDEVRALAAGIPEAEIPDELDGDGLATALATGRARIFRVLAHGRGLPGWANDGEHLALAGLLGDKHVRLLLWTPRQHLPLEQVEDAIGRLLLLAFESPATVAVYIPIGIEFAAYVLPLVRIGLLLTDDLSAAREGSITLTMPRWKFRTIVPWGPSCSS